MKTNIPKQNKRLLKKILGLKLYHYVMYWKHSEEGYHFQTLPLNNNDQVYYDLLTHQVIGLDNPTLTNAMAKRLRNSLVERLEEQEFFKYQIFLCWLKSTSIIMSFFLLWFLIIITT